MGKATKTTFVDLAQRPINSDINPKLIENIAKGQHWPETFGVELKIGPAEAEYLLASNEGNRNLSPTKIAQYVDDMRHGRFTTNGETVIVARTGELNDGQNRLQAVIVTGIPQKILVAFGVERETRATVDLGKIRTTADTLAINHSLGNLLTSTTRLVIGYEAQEGKVLGRTSSVSTPAIRERIENDDMLVECTQYIDTLRNKGIKLSVRAFCFYVLANIAPREAKQFITQLSKGTDLTEDSPIYKVRERIDGNTSKSESAELIFRAWNHWIAGETPKRLQMGKGLPSLKRPKAAVLHQKGNLPYAPPVERILIHA